MGPNFRPRGCQQPTCPAVTSDDDDNSRSFFLQADKLSAASATDAERLKVVETARSAGLAAASARIAGERAALSAVQAAKPEMVARDLGEMPGLGPSRWASRSRRPVKCMAESAHRCTEEISEEYADGSPALPPCSGAKGSVPNATAVRSSRPLSVPGAECDGMARQPTGLRRSPSLTAPDQPAGGDDDDRLWSVDTETVPASLEPTARATREASGGGNGPLVVRAAAYGRSSPSSTTTRIRLKPQHQQVVDYFFAHAPSSTSGGHALRFHMHGPRASVYAAIIATDLEEHKDSQYLVLAPSSEAKDYAANVLRRAGLRVASVEAGSGTAPKQPGGGTWHRPPDAVVCRYEDAAALEGCKYRIKILEETANGPESWQAYERTVQMGISADLVVHFADAASGQQPPAKQRTGGDDTAKVADGETWFAWLTKPYDMLWKALIRPPRARYSLADLGMNMFVYEDRVYQRQDLQLTNDRGHILECSHFYLRGDIAMRQLCVVYLHGNCSSRLECFYVLPALLSKGLSVFCLDLAGSGWSGGEYISLGYYEERDVKVAICHLRDTGAATAIALWGRSMGAAAAVLRASKDPDIAACVLDSPFADLRLVVEEYMERTRIKLPQTLLGMGVGRIQEEIKARIDVDLFNLKPLEYAPRAKIPAVFGVAKDDTFIQPHHTLDLHNAWGGSRRLLQFDGGHSGRRPSWFLEQAAEFLQTQLGAWAKMADIPREDGPVPTFYCGRAATTPLAESRRLFAL